MTKLILNPFTKPSFNLALEEYVFKNFKDSDVIILWRNEPSVIIGKNQNAYAEIDLDFVRQNNISVIRRLTGGGAVFHDLGNVNYTFVSDYESGELDSFKAFAAPVCAFLRNMGLDAEFSGRNDITVGNAKISGTAKTAAGGRSLAHGTLLYSADLLRLSKALKPNLKKLEDKAVRSVKSRVCNISELLENAPSVEEFAQRLAEFFLKEQDVCLYELSESDVLAVKQIEKEKYGSWQWNFAASPDFSFKSERKFPFGIVECHLNVSEGKISDIRFFGDFFSNRDIADLEETLKGIKLERESLLKRLSDLPASQFIVGITADELINLILGSI